MIKAINEKEPTMRTMTNSQMKWNLKHGFAWFETGADGQPNDDWRMPIWTKDGGWMWDANEQRYQLEIV
jgi:hypothetical protein